jgi:hypothetical protein
MNPVWLVKCCFYGIFPIEIQVIPKRGNGADITEVRGLSLTEVRELSDFIRLKRVAIDAIALVEQRKGPILAIVQKVGDKIPLNGMILQEVMSVSYEYPPAIVRAEEKLREQKKIMQIDHRARKIEKPCLLCTEAK